VKKVMKFGEAEASQMCQQVCATLLECDPRSTRGERAEQLLEVLHYVEQFAVHLPAEKFSEMITRAVVACGFDDELDAWHAMVSVLEPGKFVDVYSSLAGIAGEGTMD
jgi:hypothetical protein